MKLSLIWRIMQNEEHVIHRGWRLRWNHSPWDLNNSLQYMLKQWIVFLACSHLLLNLGISCTIHWFTSSSSERATSNLPKLRAKWLPGLLAQETNKIHKSSNKLFPKHTKKVTKFGWEVLTGICLSVWLEFSNETGEKVCVTLFSGIGHKLA